MFLNNIYMPKLHHFQQLYESSYNQSIATITKITITPNNCILSATQLTYSILKNRQVFEVSVFLGVQMLTFHLLSKLRD